MSDAAKVAAPTSPPPHTPTSAEVENRAAIRNAFAVKEPKPPSRKPLWLVMGTLGVAAIGIGGYVWFQLQGMNQGSLRAANNPRPPMSESIPASPNPAPMPQSASTPPPAVPIFAPNSPSTATLVENPERPIKPVQRAETSRYSQPNPARETEVNTSVRLIRTQPEPDANVQRGYLHHAVRTPGIGDDDLVGPQDTIHRCSYLLRFVEGDDVGSDFWLNGATHLDFSSFSSRGSACYRQSDANGHVL